MTSRNPLRSAKFTFLAVLACGTAAHAELVIAPVFNRVEGSGPTMDFDLGLLAHTPLQVPGDHFAYVSGDPRDPVLDVVHFWNDSPYDITGFSLRIVGTGTDTEDPSTIVLDENVDARFGNVEGHPYSSDIFSNIEITEGGKAIHFSGGVIPPGGRFTDLHYADSDLVPEIQDFDYAAVDSWFDGVPADPRLCLVQNDPVAAQPFNLVNAYCVPPTQEIGNPGEPANILGSGEFAANDQGQLDVFVIWEPLEVGVFDEQSFTYSSSLSWSSDQSDARIKEWVGNFNPGPDTPFAVMITDSGDAALTPAEFSATANSATITDRTFDSSQFPPPIGRYHIQVTGLEPGELVTFSKSAAGGQVIVPEPSSLLLGMLGFLSLLFFRMQR